jgi:hypothetical protein
MSNKFKNAGRRLTNEELDAIEESNKPLKPLPPLPSDAMDKKKKGGMSKYKAQPMPYTEGAMEEPKMKRMPYIEDAMEEFKMKPMPYYEDDDMGLEDEKLKPGQEYRMKKGGMTKGQKKVGKVMSEFKSGKLKSSSGKKVTNPKQAIAIGLSEAGMSKKKMGGEMMIDKKLYNDNSSQYSHGGMSKKKMQDGGMVRGSGAAIKGLKKVRIY